MSETFTVEVPGAVTAGAVAEKITLPFSGTLDEITLSAGTAASSPAVVDVLLNGTSVYKTIGKVAGVDSTGQNKATSDISATDTRIGITVDGTVNQEGILRDTFLQIESEIIKAQGAEVASNSQQGAGSTAQSAGGVESSTSAYTLAVNALRAQKGTTAASHAHGTPVSAVKATLDTGSTSTGSTPGLGEPIEFQDGDVLSFSVSGGSGLGDLTIEVDVTRD